MATRVCCRLGLLGGSGGEAGTATVVVAVVGADVRFEPAVENGGGVPRQWRRWWRGQSVVVHLLDACMVE